MTFAIVTNTPEDLSRDLLVIERLAAALEKAASVDEIKDVRDRSMAIQLYTRKKAGGLAAAQSAGRVVTDATARLAALYHSEKEAPRGMKPAVQLHDLDHAIGKVALANAAGIDQATLSRLKPLVEAPPERVEAAKVAIEARGDVATPSAVVRELTAVSASSDYDGDEWYTPPDVIELARGVLGEIDLDPASNLHAQKTVRAKTFWTKDDDSLTREWHGRVFCNPPYSTTRVSAAIYLVNNCTETGWFQSMASRFPFCLPAKRLGFYNRHGAKQAARQGQTIFYTGGAKARFSKAFSELGVVVASSGDPSTGNAVRWQRIGTKENSRPCSMREVIEFCSAWEACARAGRAA